MTKPTVTQFVPVNLPLKAVLRGLSFEQSTEPKLAKNKGMYNSNPPSYYMLHKMMYNFLPVYCIKLQ